MVLDERVLPIVTDGGRRWEDAFRSMQPPASFEHWAAHMRGSPTLAELFRRAGGSLMHHRSRVRAANVGSRQDAHEHCTIAAALELLACVCPRTLGGCVAWPPTATDRVR